MASFASATLLGHLGRDPDTRFSQAGTAITTFSIATSRKDGQGAETTTWWRCTVFGKRGEVIAQYFRKGDLILVQGEPSLREYTANDGAAKTSAELIVNDFAFVKGKKDADSDYRPAPQPGYTPPSAASPTEPATAWDDDIPF
jgi:single-strand DNA-binding protein